MMEPRKKFFNRYTLTAALFVLTLFYFFAGMLMQARDIKKTVHKDIARYKELTQPNPRQIVNKTISCFNRAVNDSVLHTNALIEWNGLVSLCIGKRMIEDANPANNVMKMDNGQLTFVYPSHTCTGALKNMMALEDYCNDNGTKLFYVQAPSKIDKYNNPLPFQITDTTNRNADRFIKGLAKRNIDFIDFRRVFHKNNLPYSDLFYNTDHHWKTETAFYSYKYILDFMNKNYGFSYDREAADMDNFETITFKDSFIGSLASRVGKWYARGYDDFSYLYYSLPSNFTYTRYDDVDGTLLLKETKKGNFHEALIQTQAVSGSGAKTHMDAVYFGGNPALAKVTNHKKDKGRLLVIEDSFGKPVSSFLTLQFQQVDILDLRDYTSKSVIEFMEDNAYRYDYVMILFNPSCFKTSTYKAQFNYIPGQKR